MRGFRALVVVLILCALCATLSGCRGTARTYLDDFRIYAAEYGVEVSWLLAVARQESSFDPEDVSTAGAVGLMQLLPSTAQWIAALNGWDCEEDMLRDPAYNIRSGAWYVRYLTDKFEGEWWIAAYNAGEGNVATWIAEGKSLDDVPFAETRTYLDRVRRYYRHYVFWGYNK